MTIEILNTTKVFGGTQQQVKHVSKVLNCDMQFSVFSEFRYLWSLQACGTNGPTHGAARR